MKCSTYEVLLRHGSQSSGKVAVLNKSAESEETHNNALTIQTSLQCSANLIRPVQ
jgi:hypothetical protein